MVKFADLRIIELEGGAWVRFAIWINALIADVHCNLHFLGFSFEDDNPGNKSNDGTRTQSSGDANPCFGPITQSIIFDIALIAIFVKSCG